MECFKQAKSVRLKSKHDKFLFADEDETHVTQDRNGASPNARWSVEMVTHGNTEPQFVRFRSRYGRFLTATNERYLTGLTGMKVSQTAVSGRPDSSVEWEPVREGFHVRLKTRYGNFLRANGGLPPWRNSITHDVPHRSATQDWILWEVEIVEILTPKAEGSVPHPVPVANTRPEKGSVHGSVQPVQEPVTDHRRSEKPSEHEPSSSYGPPQLKKLESSDSFSVPLRKVEGREIYYKVADDNGNVDEDSEGHHFTFNGSNLRELTQILKEETGLDSIILCTKNIINKKLVMLTLSLPPHNHAMHLVIVPGSSKAAERLRIA